MLIKSFQFSTLLPVSGIFLIPVFALLIIMPVAAVITSVLVYQGSRKKPFNVLWILFSVVSLFLIVIAQINSGIFNKPDFIVIAYTFTGIISLILSAAMLIVINVLKPKKTTRQNELKKMNIQDLE